MPEGKNINIEQGQTSVEQIPVSEQNMEQAVVASSEKPVEQLSVQSPVNQAVSSDVSSQNTLSSISADINLEKVESILSTGLDNVYLSLDATEQAQFRLKGEETAKKINILLRQSQVKIRNVISVILEWLRLIPRVNKHYVEQEAKIKAEAIIKMYQSK